MLSFLGYLLKGYRWQILLIILVGFLSIGMGLLSVWLSMCIIDVVTKVRPGDWVMLGISFIVTLATLALLRICSISLTNKTMVRMGNTIRHKVFSHLLYARWQSLRELHSGDMLTRIIKDTDDVVQLLVVALPTTIISAVQLLGSLVLLYILDSTLALMLGLGMPLALLFSKIFYRRMLSYSATIKKTESNITTMMHEALGNQTVIRTFERQEEQINQLEMTQGHLYKQVCERILLTVYGNVMVSAAFSGGYAIAFIWGAWSLLRGFITFGTMTSFLQLVSRIQKPMGDLMSSLPHIINSKAALDRLVGMLGYQTEGFAEKPSVLSSEIRLEIDNMSFRYEEGEPYVFDSFSLEAKSGEMIAIMGETGSGKTTLLRLLLGLMKPESGSIKLSDPHKSLSVSETTRGNFVYVPQGNSLLSGTIRDNLLIGDMNATERQIEVALSIACATFVWDLPNQLDTLLGEKGLGLSEGQAQRIAIARSLLRPGRILLLDEATSALDLETEKRLIQKLKEHLSGRIILFITHHKEVANACDKVVYI